MSIKHRVLAVLATAGLTTAAMVGLIAGPAAAAPAATGGVTSVATAADSAAQASGQYDTLDDIGILACLRVVAVDMRVFTSSTSNTVIGRKFYGDIVTTTASANNRYRITSPLGWISADPRWTDPC